MPDRRKLAAPVLAQAASFVVVLVIGGLTGHSAAPGPAPPSPSPHVTTSSPAATRSNQPGVIVEVSFAGGVVPRIPVRVLAGTATVASGTLSPDAQDTLLEWSQALNPGTYQVCAQPPAGLHFTEKSTGALHGWICTAADVTAGSQVPVTFHLAPGVS